MADGRWGLGRWAVGLAFGLWLSCSVGCGPKPSGTAASKAAEPTVAELLADLEKQAAAIKDAYAKGDMEAADEPLHQVARSVQAITGAAKKSGISGENGRKVEAAAENLLDAFGKLHDNHHDGGGTTKYEDVGGTIDTAIADIKAATAK
ncbi:MAG: hypothetical protein U0795_07390 [Pirellulales bacterium]